MNILLRSVSNKAGKTFLSKQLGMKVLNEISNDYGTCVVNFATSKNRSQKAEVMLTVLGKE
jgi:hypothetical protein